MSFPEQYLRDVACNVSDREFKPSVWRYRGNVNPKSLAAYRVHQNFTLVASRVDVGKASALFNSNLDF